MEKLTISDIFFILAGFPGLSVVVQNDFIEEGKLQEKIIAGEVTRVLIIIRAEGEKDD